MTVNKTDAPRSALSESRDNSFRDNKGVRSLDINSFCDSPSKTPIRKVKCY